MQHKILHDLRNGPNMCSMSKLGQVYDFEPSKLHGLRPIDLRGYAEFRLFLLIVRCFAKKIGRVESSARQNLIPLQPRVGGN